MDSMGNYAQDVCSDCGSCAAGGGMCVDIPGWNVGYGTCDTYGPNGYNNYWCDKDMDSMGNYAQDVCSDCGSCTAGGGGMCVDIPGWNVGYGTCDTYGPNGYNNYWCDKDMDTAGNYAQDVCSECGSCTAPLGPPMCVDIPGWNVGY